MKKLFWLLYLLIALISWQACKQEPAKTTTTSSEINLNVPSFSDDSAYASIATQVAFGPRHPNSQAVENCRKWISKTLERYGLTVILQPFEAKGYTGTAYKGVNIIGIYKPEHTKRIMFSAHYDTRFMAEEDPQVSRQKEPILGADDGASGVAVLLELARITAANTPDLGIDFVFFDLEDQGERNGSDIKSWCLGAQHWSRQPHASTTRAKYGILLDMVGGRNARFLVEDVRNTYAPDLAGRVTALYIKVWKTAQSLGKSNYFADGSVSGIIDDHYFVNSIAGIPTIDIINKPPDTNTGFPAHWHTHSDDLPIIDKRTLKAVGTVMINVIYQESRGLF